MSTTTHFTRIRQLHTKEAGMVSIMVTMILMIVISLTVLGFAQIARRDQRESLDNQLSTQAFYAAESGVNEARNIISTTPADQITAKTTCGNPGGPSIYSGLNPTLDATHAVSYSCLLVNPGPLTLTYSDIGTNSTVVPLIPASGNLGSVTLTWKTKATLTPPTTAVTGCPTTTANVFSANWGCSGYGVLRFDLVPTGGSGLTASSLMSTTMTTFAVPLRTGGTNSIAFGAQTNAVVGTACTATQCSLKVTGLNNSQYYLQVSSIYQDVSLQVNGTNTAGTAVGLIGAQVLIDSTGKAQDVLRRIQVRVPANGANSQSQLPNDALESTDSVCKRYSAMDGYFANSPDVTGTNVLCKP